MPMVQILYAKLFLHKFGFNYTKLTFLKCKQLNLDLYATYLGMLLGAITVLIQVHVLFWCQDLEKENNRCQVTIFSSDLKFQEYFLVLDSQHNCQSISSLQQVQFQYETILKCPDNNFSSKGDSYSSVWNELHKIMRATYMLIFVIS